MLVLCAAVVGAGFYVSSRFQAAGKPSTVATSAAASAPATGGGCAYQPSGSPATRPVGTPSTSDIPRSGQQKVTITTNQGVVEFTMDTAKAPCAAHSFTFLAGKKFYDNTPCHRLLVTGAYMLQCGDPSGTGTGGPGYQYASENLPTGQTPPYPAGTVAIANAASPDTNGSQFFLVYKDSSFDGPNYPVLGQITRGLDVLLKIAAGGTSGPQQDTPNTKVQIASVTVS